MNWIVYFDLAKLVLITSQKGFFSKRNTVLSGSICHTKIDKASSNVTLLIIVVQFNNDLLHKNDKQIVISLKVISLWCNLAADVMLMDVASECCHVGIF
ncbi:hypothetical protein T10_2365 [Trichinella papuae]|uniref:Uncharacterized protein n=1 Tax=Trichinella papuae TaxID=268474 RepID=A0A0V1N4M8_9BILA|nr:hypothetical protein T10_2365 [Trichinella papuae]